MNRFLEIKYDKLTPEQMEYIQNYVNDRHIWGLIGMLSRFDLDYFHLRTAESFSMWTENMNFTEFINYHEIYKDSLSIDVPRCRLMNSDIINIYDITIFIPSFETTADSIRLLVHRLRMNDYFITPVPCGAIDKIDSILADLESLPKKWSKSRQDWS